MSYHVDAIVIGAGVIGLACARKLAKLGLETILLESQSSIGQGISSRNSEVIHAGIYYKQDSWKAKLCVQGKEALYQYCETRHIPHQRIGKWIVATHEAQVQALQTIASRAAENGCHDLTFIDKDDARKIEPQLRCELVLNSPSTGIIDSHSLMQALYNDFERAGGALAVCSPVAKGEITEKSILLHLNDQDKTTISATHVINAAGLEAPNIAAQLINFPKEHIPSRCYAKGSYFTLAGKSPFQRLIYPVPEAGGLGVHLTLDMAGCDRFGPDVEWIDEPNYVVDSAKISKFYEAIKNYWPGCDESRLTPGYAGVRPKLGLPQHFSDDFVIQGPEIHEVHGLMNLFGIESPGLTSCLSMADEVARQLVQ